MGPVWRAVLIVLLSPLIVSAAGQETPAETTADRLWRGFRAAFPYHVQTIAVSDPDPDGTRVLLIAEPPPHITVDALRAVAPGALSLKDQPIGVDGYARDVVVTLPPMTQAGLDEVLARVHLTLFDTTYKAYAVHLPVDAASAAAAPLDLSVSTADLDRLLFETPAAKTPVRRWLAVLLLGVASATAFLWLAAGPTLVRLLVFLAWGWITIYVMVTMSPLAVTGVRFVDDTTAVRTRSTQALIDGSTSGVFHSEMPGVVVWSTARTLSAADRAAFRQFALDSDLILGGIASGDRLLVVGRERVTSLAAFPPLRAETMLQLATAAAKTDELAQSYERQNVFAGRFDDRHDWAPIYLSDSLIDTEYGSLLNIADQLLKSWSQHGEVKYHRFDYSAPVSYPFPTALSRTTQARQVTFNWNTRGAGYAVERPARTVYALNRTGALPVDYLGDEDTRLAEAEDRAYDYFAETNDPTLVRVVQYAALFQMFRRFGVTGPEDTTVTHAAETFLSLPGYELLSRLRAFTLEAAISLHQEGTDDRAISDEEREALFEEASLLAALGNVLRDTSEERLSPEQIGRLALALVDPAAFQALRASDPSESSDDELIGRLASAITSVGRYLWTVEAADRARDNYVLARRRTTFTWIRTPTIVVSWNEGPQGAAMIGGHNLSAAVSDFKPNPTITRGKVKILDDGGRRVVYVHPDDEARIARLVRTTGRNQEKTAGELETLLNARMSGAATSRPPLPQLLRLPDGFSRRETRGLAREQLPAQAFQTGWWWGAPPDEQQRAVATLWASRGGSAVIVERTANGGYAIYQPVARQVVEAGSVTGGVEAVVRSLGTASKAGTVTELHFRGVSVDSARGFLQSVEARAPRNRLLVGTVDSAKASVDDLSALFKGNYRWTGATIEEIEALPATSGIHVNIRVPNVAAQSPSLPVQLKIQCAKGVQLTADLLQRVRDIVEAWIAALQDVTSHAEAMLMVRRLRQDLERITPGATATPTVKRTALDIQVVERASASREVNAE